MPALPTFHDELYLLIAFLALLLVGTGWRAFNVAIRAAERNTDRVIDSHRDMAAALGEQRTWCGQADGRLLGALADRDERLIMLLTQHHEQLMEGVAEVLRYVRAGENAGGANGAALPVRPRKPHKVEPSAPTG